MKWISEVLKGLITLNMPANMPIALFGKVEQHNHDYHGPAYINPTIYHVDKETALEIAHQCPNVHITHDETATDSPSAAVCGLPSAVSPHS